MVTPRGGAFSAIRSELRGSGFGKRQPLARSGQRRQLSPRVQVVCGFGSTIRHIE